MHTVEPFYEWRDYYIASEDSNSPFFENTYSEFEFSNSIYNFYIHPQWDSIDSPTLFLKILFADYNEGFVIIEFIGEWNDAIENDIMTLKRNIVEPMIDEGIIKFILIGENILNFHYSDDCYYEEWFDDIDDGWITLINFHDHVLNELKKVNIDNYFVMGGELQDIEWRTYNPNQLFNKINRLVTKRLN